MTRKHLLNQLVGSSLYNNIIKITKKRHHYVLHNMNYVYVSWSCSWKQIKKRLIPIVFAKFKYIIRYQG